jgi:hypothetical protein
LSDETISTKNYISIFHQLFFVSYFNELSTSEQALKYLLNPSYVNGLVAGLPNDINVAHKFGERFIDDDSNVIQLHDCGIVYFPGNPYSICVMTQGHDLRELEDVIAEISKKVYTEFNSRKR